MSIKPNKSTSFGTEPIINLLRQQAIPASIGILIMSIYGIVDTIFVGRWVGSNGIAGVTVVFPITFLISSFGMAVGIGGSSVLSRALGNDENKKALTTFGNQVLLTLVLAITFMVVGFVFEEEILNAFGGKGEVLQPAKEYFHIVLFGVPFLSWAMMANNVIRAEGFPKVAMVTMIVPAVMNLILDPLFIGYYEWGMAGAAWATVIGYIASAIFTLWFFLFGKSELNLSIRSLAPNWGIIKEISAIGSVTLARQGTISVLAIILNNALFNTGGALALSAYGILNRMMMFANFPVIGITQGFMPIAGYNYGAKFWGRLKETVNISIKTASIIAVIIFTCIMIFAPSIVKIFTTDQELIEIAIPALRIAFLATPLIALGLIGSAYFQAIGKALPALLLTLTKQGFFLIPLILILPPIFGVNGIWYSFPIADIGAASITYFYLRKQMRKIPT
ncbi:MATE family efflux transporter [Portibacter lacus]|uniref:Multidrug export protein MepA n=1 Tax=Portibacter lacus TaxID=1099794 RepID=A0AA37SPW5_9BACT|nr:MATE family efflux transporter [Portibacter lacus]GLR17049.1 MATE family efflux transporter [Portibacter lacus]